MECGLKGRSRIARIQRKCKSLKPFSQLGPPPLRRATRVLYSRLWYKQKRDGRKTAPSDRATLRAAGCGTEERYSERDLDRTATY